MRLETALRHARQGSPASGAFVGMMFKMGGKSLEECPFDATTEAEAFAAFRNGFDVAEAPSVVEKPLPQPRPIKVMPAHDYEEFPRFLYLVRTDGATVRKIGITRFPLKRIRGLAASSGAHVAYEALYRVRPSESVKLLERMMHESLRDHWSHGEWFHVDGAVFHTLAADLAKTAGLTLEAQLSPPVAVASWPHRERNASDQARPQTHPAPTTLEDIGDE